MTESPTAVTCPALNPGAGGGSGGEVIGPWDPEAAGGDAVDGSVVVGADVVGGTVDGVVR